MTMVTVWLVEVSMPNALAGRPIETHYVAAFLAAEAAERAVREQRHNAKDEAVKALNKLDKGIVAQLNLRDGEVRLLA
jgi:hypothetical protein